MRLVFLLLAVGQLQAAPRPPARFSMSDITNVSSTEFVWLIHDNLHKDQCVLVMKSYDGVKNPMAMTSQVWPCN